MMIVATLPVSRPSYWGPEFRLFYNDGYRPFLEERHPWALGRPMSKIWPTMWEGLSAPAQAVMETGEGVVAENQQLMMDRGDGHAESFWYYSFAPIRSDTDRVDGIFLTALDTTQAAATTGASLRVDGGVIDTL